MTRVDPLALDSRGVSLHQLATFVIGAGALSEALERSPLFALGKIGDIWVAEWFAMAPEETLPYPLGRVTLHPRGILLEGFAESRLEEMTRHLDALGPLRITADETRAFRLEELLAEPERALQSREPVRGGDAGGRALARWYLRAGWTYQPCAELDDRPPYVVAQTGRGRKRIEALLDGLPARLEERYPGFPRFEPDELRRLLIPLPAPAPSPPAEAPHASRAPRRA